MSKQFWAGFLFAFVIFGISYNWIGSFVAIVAWTIGMSIVFHVFVQNYEKRIEALVEIKGRQKMHLRRFTDANDRLRKEGRIVLYEELVDEKLRKSLKKKKRKSDANDL